MCSKAQVFQSISCFLSHLPQTKSTGNHYPQSPLKSVRAGDAAQPLPRGKGIFRLVWAVCVFLVYKWLPGLIPCCLAVLMCSGAGCEQEGTAGSPLTSSWQCSPPAPNVPQGAQAAPLAAEAKWGCDLGAVLSSCTELLVPPSKGTALHRRLCSHLFLFLSHPQFCACPQLGNRANMWLSPCVMQI